MAIFKFFVGLICTTALIVLLNVKISALPPLGKFFDPAAGVWQNAETVPRPASETLEFSALTGQVTVLYDHRQVPHIFAENDRDLYFAQGFVTARDRLWQMDFQTRAAAGRLSEVLGSMTFEYDRFQRRIGMPVAAQNALQLMEIDPVVRLVINAYVDGINAYINTLEAKDYPLEYKILDYAPEPWTPLKCALMMKTMAWDLSGRSIDLQMTNTLSRFGPDVVADLFDEPPASVEPVIPRNTVWPFQPLQVQQPDTLFLPSALREAVTHSPNPNNGSNNWAVSGAKTATGYPILANDPHLDFTLPSIWHEIQLHAPGINVYGVSLPGVPHVIIGFNEQIAWGTTNGADDVLDWYEIKFKDRSLRQYWHDGQWKPVRRVLEQIKIRDRDTVTDTVLYTHHGPIVLRPGEEPFSRQTPTLHAMRWIGHETGNEGRAFYDLNRAKNYDDFLSALFSYDCPAQNFVYADAGDTIALWHHGKLPLKWPEQGRYISDGTDPRYDWQGWIPKEQNPHVLNPPRGFVSSANQPATDDSYPYFLGRNFGLSYRGARINEWLENSDNMQPEESRILQLDTKDLHAETALPAMLRLLDRTDLDETEETAREILASWDYFSDAGKIAPTIFDVWWDKFYNAIWQDDFGSAYLRWPSKERSARLLVEDTNSDWFDDQTTAALETAESQVRITFRIAVIELGKKLGPLQIASNSDDNRTGLLLNPDWRWGHFKGVDINHLAHIPGLGRPNLDVGGGYGIVNATGKRHGPSWRMVVSLGPEVEGWGIYPGGQSGNPGSPHYDDFVDEWVRGDLADLLFLRDLNQATEQIESRLILK